MSEARKIQEVIKQSAAPFAQYMLTPGTAEYEAHSRKWMIPANYVCHLCKKESHLIADCPMVSIQLGGTCYIRKYCEFSHVSLVERDFKYK